MRNERLNEPLSGEELEAFVQYLHRFCKHDLDLFTTMEAGDPDYPAYVTLTREPIAGIDRAAYRRP
ncbi:hypothetical protein ACFZB6_26150 [Streptomyces syringium]|uniref:hypothetical protein n=1 Tax=Streptomyces syringium TaxID=76729 RepID=UPI0033B6C886